MPVHISKSDLARLSHKAASLAKRASHMRGKTEKAVEHVVSLAETAAAAFGFGMVQGRFGDVRVVGVPVELLFGGGAHVLGFVGIAGPQSYHLHAFADGAIAAYLTTLARGIGLDMKRRALGEAVSGDGRRLSEAQLAAMAAAAR